MRIVQRERLKCAICILIIKSLFNLTGDRKRKRCQKRKVKLCPGKGGHVVIYHISRKELRTTGNENRRQRTRIKRVIWKSNSRQPKKLAKWREGSWPIVEEEYWLLYNAHTYTFTRTHMCTHVHPLYIYIYIYIYTKDSKNYTWYLLAKHSAL